MARMYYRPIVSCDAAIPVGARKLAGGRGWYAHVEVLQRGVPARVISVADMPEGAAFPDGAAGNGRPHIMGILNITPDSFSDGGQHLAVRDAVEAGLAMAAAGADILDIGGESTRPGAQPVDVASEIARVIPVIRGLRAAGHQRVISVDTRKAAVAAAAMDAGADLINDVSGLTHDPDMVRVVVENDASVCVMHGPVDPATMHLDPTYDDVLLDVYDWLEARIAVLLAAGVPHHSITADPGIGFAKTQEHNLALLARLSLFAGLGVPILLGASRKRFIGRIGNAPNARDRMPGSVAVALAGIAQGVQVVRVHDVAETAQAIAVWRASVTGN